MQPDLTPLRAEVPLALWRAVGFTPHAGQLADLQVIHQALTRAPGAPRLLDITTGRQYGKTTEAAMTVLEGALLPPDASGPPVVKVIADTYEHANLIWDKVAAAIFGSELRGLLDTSMPGKGYDRERWILTLKSGATIQKLSADRPQSLAGHTITLAVVDEKAFVSDAAMEMLLPCLAVRSGVAVAFGTAEGAGWGRTWSFRGKDEAYPEHWSAVHPSTDNPFLPLETLEQARRSMPARRFQQLWLAQWVSEDGSVFHHLEECAEPSWPEEAPPVAGRRYVMGLDLARYEDYTALVVADRDTRRCVHRERFHLTDWTGQAARIARVARRYNDARVWADTTHGSVGDVVAELLKRDYELDVHGYPLTNASKVALIDRLVWALEREEVRFPAAWRDLMAELTLYAATVSAAGNTKLSAPTGFHDDLVIALALCNYGLHKGGAAGGGAIPRQVAGWEYL